MSQSESAAQLSQEGRKQVALRYQERAADVVAEVSRWLRRKAAGRTATSTSAVAGEVWESLIEKHQADVDFSDPNGVWTFLLAAAKRHCEKYNKRATRHPLVSLGNADSDSGYDPQDTREPLPETQAIINELSALFEWPVEEAAPAAATLLASEPRGLGLMPRLTSMERNVLALKVVGQTRPEISQRLGIEPWEVDEHWKSIKGKGQNEA